MKINNHLLNMSLTILHKFIVVGFFLGFVGGWAFSGAPPPHLCNGKWGYKCSICKK